MLGFITFEERLEIAHFLYPKMKGEEEMYTEKFLQQAYRKLNEQGITNSKLGENCISI